jgi:probable phosphoglycerate mutase
VRLYIIRHADPDYPNNTITAAGHLEAKALSERMQREGLDRIYASPMGRARHTAQYSADALQLPVHIEEWTAELGNLRMEDAPFAGMAAWDIHGEVFRGGETMPMHHNWHELPLLSGPHIRETFENVKAGSDEFLARHGYEREGGLYRVRQRHQEKIAVFCHGGLGLTWLAHLLEIPLPLMWSGFFLAPSSVTTILFDERSQEFAVPRCLGMGDTSHLYHAGLPIQPAGIKANYY